MKPFFMSKESDLSLCGANKELSVRLTLLLLPVACVSAAKYDVKGKPVGRSVSVRTSRNHKTCMAGAPPSSGFYTNHPDENPDILHV